MALGDDTGIVLLGNWLKSKGFDVGEHPSFGGVAPVHTTNSYHYKGQAIDVNWGSGGTAELAKLQPIYNELRRQEEALAIVEVLLEDVGEQNQHLHVAIVGAPTPALEALVKGEVSIQPEDTAGAVGDAAGEVAGFAGELALKIAKAVVTVLIDAIGEDGLRALLYVVLVLGGTGAVVFGVSRGLGAGARPEGAPA